MPQPHLTSHLKNLQKRIHKTTAQEEINNAVNLDASQNHTVKSLEKCINRAIHWRITR